MKRPAGTFFEVPQRVMTLDLSMGARMTLVALCKFANYETGESYPGLKALEKAVGANRSSIKRYVQELERRRIVGVQRRRGPRGTSKYRIAKWLWACTEMPGWAHGEPTESREVTVSPQDGSNQAPSGFTVHPEQEPRTRTKEREKTSGADAPDPLWQDLVDLYSRLYEEHVGVKPPRLGASLAALSRVRKAVGGAKTAELIELWFRTADPWPKRSGYGLQHLESHLPSLLDELEGRPLVDKWANIPSGPASLR